MSTATFLAASAQQDTTTLQLKIGGMSCSFCANSIEGALFKEKGLDEVHVSLAHEEALVRYRADKTTPTKIIDTLRALGFSIRDPDKVKAFKEQQQLVQQEHNDLMISAAVAIGMLAAMVAMWLDLWQMREGHIWVAWAASTFVFA